MKNNIFKGKNKLIAIVSIVICAEILLLISLFVLLSKQEKKISEQNTLAVDSQTESQDTISAEDINQVENTQNLQNPQATPEVTMQPEVTAQPEVIQTPEAIQVPIATPQPSEAPMPAATQTPQATQQPSTSTSNAYTTQTISWNPNWNYASYSQIHTGSVTLYKSVNEGRKVIAINAGHGTSGGSSVKTLCHPDGSAKVTGGSTGKGATHASAVSSGTTMLDGTAEAVVTLKLARIVKDKLLDAGFSVLMIRESEDVQLDNIARTVFANEKADCHIALHYDSTDNDKGFFYIGVPDIASYKNMEPVASHWRQHNALGESLLAGMRAQNVKIYSSGNIPMDLTQTSYSTVPSIDVEVGDRGSDYSDATLNQLADGIVAGVKLHFGSN